jgi:hypothetical protein
VSLRCPEVAKQITAISSGHGDPIRKQAKPGPSTRRNRCADLSAAPGGRVHGLRQLYHSGSFGADAKTRWRKGQGHPTGLGSFPTGRSLPVNRRIIYNAPPATSRPPYNPQRKPCIDRGNRRVGDVPDAPGPRLADRQKGATPFIMKPTTGSLFGPARRGALSGALTSPLEGRWRRIPFRTAHQSVVEIFTERHGQDRHADEKYP